MELAILLIILSIPAAIMGILAYVLINNNKKKLDKKSKKTSSKTK